MLDNIGGALLAFLWAALAAPHPWAAAGASFGCIFYLMTPAVLEGSMLEQLGQILLAIVTAALNAVPD